MDQTGYLFLRASSGFASRAAIAGRAIDEREKSNMPVGVVAYNLHLAGLAQQRNPKLITERIGEIRRKGYLLNSFTFSSVFEACVLYEKDSQLEGT